MNKHAREVRSTVSRLRRAHAGEHFRETPESIGALGQRLIEAVDLTDSDVEELMKVHGGEPFAEPADAAGRVARVIADSRQLALTDDEGTPLVDQGGQVQLRELFDNDDQWRER